MDSKPELRFYATFDAPAPFNLLTRSLSPPTALSFSSPTTSQSSSRDSTPESVDNSNDKSPTPASSPPTAILQPSSNNDCGPKLSQVDELPRPKKMTMAEFKALVQEILVDCGRSKPTPKITRPPPNNRRYPPFFSDPFLERQKHQRLSPRPELSKRKWNAYVNESEAVGTKPVAYQIIVSPMKINDAELAQYREIQGGVLGAGTMLELDAEIKVRHKKRKMYYDVPEGGLFAPTWRFPAKKR